jgi:hypothetical protein
VLDKGQGISYDEIDLSSSSVRTDAIIFLQSVPDDRHRETGTLRQVPRCRGVERSIMSNHLLPAGEDSFAF